MTTFASSADVKIATPLANRIRPSARHSHALDGVRAIAVLIVMAFHAQCLLSYNEPVARLFCAGASIGWSGVDLFFVLSGFLITGILLDTRDAPGYFSAFYMRRVLRIFPLYYAVLLGMVAAAQFSKPLHDALPQHMLPYFLYVANWTDPLTPGLGLTTGHFWTLAVEEQFYLLWPLIVSAVPSSAALRRICVGGLVIAFALRCILLVTATNRDLMYKALFTHMDGLLVGAFCAALVRERGILRIGPYVGRLAVVLALVTFAPAFALHAKGNASTYMETIGYSLLAFTFGACVLWAYTRGESTALLPRVLRSRAVTEIGKVSYGMYIFHLPMVFLLGLLPAKVGGAAAAGFLFPLTFLIAKLSYELFEKPFLALKTHFRAI